MKIAYIGDFINHGASLQTSGTPLVILLSEIEETDSIDVYCPKINKEVEEFRIPKKVNIISFYEYDNPISIMRLLRINWKNYDLIIFNILPTGFGQSSISNLIALIMPLIIMKLLRNRNVRVIYHNSVFTNDFKVLGYNSIYNKIRSYFLGKIEKLIFKNVPTYVLLKLYKERINKAIGRNRVSVLSSNFLEAVTTIYINNAIENRFLEFNRSEIPTILLHGNWGPQKNIDLALSSLLKLQSNGVKFRLIISGGINNHFPNYELKFKRVLKFYSNIIFEYLGYVKESELMYIFLRSDIVLLPYKTPGGHSGVLEQAMFFEVPVIAFDFPEYEEQCGGNNKVKLIKEEEMIAALVECLNLFRNYGVINIDDKIGLVRSNIKSILGQFDN